MKKVLMPFMLIVACSWFVSCEVDDDSPNFYFTALNTIEADVPESFEFGKTYDIEVTYQRPNGCTFFEGFDVVQTAETGRDVVVVGSVLTDEDRACTEAVEEVVAILKFNVIYTKDYVFRFYAGDDDQGNATYLEYSVPIAEEGAPTN
ncbi:hypothetical protein D2V08_06645 [Flagellimonas lutimaris]|uniref:DUF4843 domain-containing protein n=1 Tax=Flagellimonas lutimaris TaxID=475082 RepID=A0A3A1NAP8_9FLAO|nr:hypothetical protein [Allomuricauda lutimaris]RIV35035.1 hypothetical protein D2V08_06645 [Allomuricauda lutimaris]